MEVNKGIAVSGEALSRLKLNKIQGPEEESEVNINDEDNSVSSDDAGHDSDGESNESGFDANDLIGYWVLAPEAGALAVGPRCCVSARCSAEQLMEPLLRRSTAEG